MTAAKGSVSVTDSSGPLTVAPPFNMAVPANLTTGADSSVSISVGQTCQLDIGENHDVDIEVIDGKLCVRFLAQGGVLDQGGGEPEGFVPVVVGFGLLGPTHLP